MPYERLLIVQSQAQANVPGGQLCKRATMECNRAEGKRGTENICEILWKDGKEDFGGC